MDERTIEDAELLAALEDREAAKEAAGEARQRVAKLTDEVKTRVEKLDLGIDTAVRVGRFRITKTMTEARHVDFDVDAKERIAIGTVDA